MDRDNPRDTMVTQEDQDTDMITSNSGEEKVENENIEMDCATSMNVVNKSVAMNVAVKSVKNGMKLKMSEMWHTKFVANGGGKCGSPGRSGIMKTKFKNYCQRQI